MICLCLNGDVMTLARSSTIHEMVAELDLPAPMLLIEHNGVALQRGDWAATKLSDGDRLEILRVSAGG